MGYETPGAPRAVVFVYGSLLRGESNHFRLSQARFLGEACTGPIFDLIDLGGYPALVAEGVSSVHGELYEVSRETLSLLDELEEHPVFYRRELVGLSDGREVMAYLLPRAKACRYHRIESGDWRNRSGTGAA